MYEYRATVARIIDGDTIDFNVDLGFHVTIQAPAKSRRSLARFRLYGINAWEKRGPEKQRGLEAKRAVEAMMPPGTEVTIRSIKDSQGKYGRFLAIVWVEVDGKRVNLNDWLVAEGHARPAQY